MEKKKALHVKREFSRQAFLHCIYQWKVFNESFRGQAWRATETLDIGACLSTGLWSYLGGHCQTPRLGSTESSWRVSDILYSKWMIPTNLGDLDYLIWICLKRFWVYKLRLKINKPSASHLSVYKEILSSKLPTIQSHRWETGNWKSCELFSFTVSWCSLGSVIKVSCPSTVLPSHPWSQVAEMSIPCTCVVLNTTGHGLAEPAGG